MKKKFYHATKYENLKSILEHGLHSRFGNEIYFSSNPVSAVDWVGAGQTGLYAVIEVHLDDKKYKPGRDHAPIMQFMFPGEVVVVNRPVYTFVSVVVYEKTEDKTMFRFIECDKHIIKNKPKAPWYKSKEQQNQEWIKTMEELKEFCEKNGI